MSGDGVTTLSVVVIVAILIVAITSIGIILFLPIKPIDMNQHREIEVIEGVENLNLDILGGIGDVEVIFDNLPDKLLTLDVHVTGGIGIFDELEDYDLKFNYEVTGEDLEVNVELDEGDIFKGINFLDTDCQVVINDALRSDIEVDISVGSIILRSAQFTSLSQVDLETSTGSVEATLVLGTTLWGDMSLETSTGSVNLEWEGVIITQDISVQLITSTGSVDIDIIQTISTGHDLVMDCITQTGSVSADLRIDGNVSSTIDWDFQTGSAKINKQSGFVLTDDHLESENYPSSEIIAVNLSTSTGNVEIWAEWGQ